jgi:hypothetical protein
LLPGNQRNVLRGIRESSCTLKLIDFLLLLFIFLWFIYFPVLGGYQVGTSVGRPLILFVFSFFSPIMDLLGVCIVLEGCLKSLKFSPMLGGNLFLKIPGSSYIFIRVCNFFFVLRISAGRTLCMVRPSDGYVTRIGCCPQLLPWMGTLFLVMPLSMGLTYHIVTG